MTAFPETTFAILGGGQGRRLGGAAKGLLEVEGRSCLARLLELGAAFADVLLVSGDARYDGFDVRRVPDLLPVPGPVAGLHSALAHARTLRVFLAACDMPFLTVDVAALLHSADVGAGAAFEVDGVLQPLPALLLRLRASEVEALAMRGERSLKGVLGGLGIARVGSLATVDPALRSLVSLNTPDDLARYGATRPLSD